MFVVFRYQCLYLGPTYRLQCCEKCCFCLHDYLYSRPRPNWYALVKSCINVNHCVLLVRRHLKYVWFTKFTKFRSEVKNGSSLGISKNKKTQLQGAAPHWPPDQGLCPKMCQQYYKTAIASIGLHLLLNRASPKLHEKKVHMIPFQLAKMKKNRRFQGWFFENFSREEPFENFSGDYAPRPPYWGGATAPHRPPALGRFAPRSLARDIRSLHRPALLQLQICHYTTAWWTRWRRGWLRVVVLGLALNPEDLDNFWSACLNADTEPLILWLVSQTVQYVRPLLQRCVCRLWRLYILAKRCFEE